jgi:hypothetical protein
MDPITIGLLAGAGLGLLSGNKKIKEKAANDRYRKVALAMSPWTGMGDPGTSEAGSMLGSAAGGALKGGMAGSMFGGAGGNKWTALGDQTAASGGMTGANGLTIQQMGMTPEQYQQFLMRQQLAMGSNDLAIG